MASNLPPGCVSDDGMTQEQRETSCQFERLCDDIWEKIIDPAADPLVAIFDVRSILDIEEYKTTRGAFIRMGAALHKLVKEIWR
jgi:hypothetical protein